MNDRTKYKLLSGLLMLSAIVIIGISSVLLYLYSEQREENNLMNLQLLQLREAHEAVLAENEVLIHENSRLDERIEEMLAQITSMDNELDERDAVISEMDVLLEEIRAEIAEKEAEADQLEHELAELEHKNEVNLLVTERLRESRNQALSSAEELKRKMEVLIRESEQKTEETTAETVPDVPEVPRMTEAEQTLFDLLETGAPPRYVKNEDGSIYSEYPHLEYAYYDFTTGKSVGYQSDEIIYSASVIKAPFVYAVIREIENFEKNKRDYDADGNPLWDADGNPLFEGSHPNYNADGTLIYLPGEEKYNLNEIWTFEPEIMMEEGSGEIMNQPAGFQLTWRELIEYALLYSDNIAFAQIRQRFGYNSFYQLVAELGVQGTATGFMNLSADDCVKFLTVMHDYMAAESDYALWMKDCMTRSKHLVILARHYPEGTCAHKYGWDIDAYHDAAVVFDEHPYALVVMSNLHDGGDIVNAYFGEIVAATKRIHAEQYPDE